MRLCTFNIMKLMKLGVIAMFALMLNVVCTDFAYSQGTEVEKINVSDLKAAECSVEVYRAQHTGGCWACLVIERLTSAFLNVAKHALPITQKAGIILLVLGTALWVLKWGLDNVSSFNEVKNANILNSLFKMCFKVMLAYWCIIYSTNVISQYFIRPIMSVGAIVGQNMWGEEIKETAEVWEDEYISEEDQKKLAAALMDANNTAGMNDENLDKSGNQDDEKASSKKPEKVEPDEYEEVVQLFQKSLVAILQQQLSEIKNSCGDSCGSQVSCSSRINKNCSYKRCSNTFKGHGCYVRELFRIGGSGGEGAYCMMSITAALEKLNKEVGGGIANFQTGKGYCLDGISVSTKYDNAAIINDVGIKGSKITDYHSVDVDLMEAIKYANVGDIVYIRVSGRVANQVSSGSGYHATAHLGGGQIISFNADGIYRSPASFVSNPQGVIIRTSEIIRQRLKKNPNAKINKARLAELANGAGINASLINYKGGSYSSFSAPVTIPKIDYTGPTNIMPKSVMNSLLNAMRVITDTLSENLVLGKMIMCYSTLENGGAWTFDMKIGKVVLTNIFKFLEGGIIFVLGIMLIIAVGYYFLDISFKVGFSVLALPITIGLWPFDQTKDKIVTVLSILMKASASFAFMALVTSYGVAMISESLGDVSVLYEKIEEVSKGGSDAEMDALNSYIDDTIWLFSPTFIMMVFAMFYFYKLISKTIDEIVDKFFQDGVFGKENPMHSTATKMTGRAVNFAKTVTGFNLAKDVASHQLGKRAKNLVGSVGKGVGFATGKTIAGAGYAVVHPMKTARKVGEAAVKAHKNIKNGVKNLFNRRKP